MIKTGVIISKLWDIKSIGDSHVDAKVKFDRSQLRQALLYWDHVNVPENSTFSTVLPDDCKSLLEEGIIQREIVEDPSFRMLGRISIREDGRISLADNIINGVVSILKRESVRKYFLNYFRKSEMNRKDIAELLSLKNIYELFGDKFEFQLFTIHSVNELFKGNKGIVWSDFHLKLLHILKKVKLDKAITKLANNRMGFINRFFTPTFYMVFKKKAKS